MNEDDERASLAEQLAKDLHLVVTSNQASCLSIHQLATSGRCAGLGCC